MANKKGKVPISSIIVVTYNALPFIKRCLSSVQRYSKNYELILVDNASEPKVTRWLKKQRGIHKIFNSRNLGFAAANNQGMKVAKGDFLILLNSDVVVTKDWISRLIKPFQEDALLGASGPYSNCAVGDQRIAVSYASLSQMYNFAQDFERKEKHTYHVSGFCMALKRQAFKRTGFFDEGFKVGTYEDVDYCIRLIQAGFSLKVANCFVHHFGSRSFMDNHQRLDIRKIEFENFKLLSQKWPYEEIKQALPQRS